MIQIRNSLAITNFYTFLCITSYVLKLPRKTCLSQCLLILAYESKQTDSIGIQCPAPFQVYSRVLCSMHRVIKQQEQQLFIDLTKRKSSKNATLQGQNNASCKLSKKCQFVASFLARCFWYSRSHLHKIFKKNAHNKKFKNQTHIGVNLLKGLSVMPTTVTWPSVIRPAVIQPYCNLA